MATRINMTTEWAHNQLASVSDKTLCDIDDGSLEWAAFETLAKDEGYPSGRAAANDLNLWGRTVHEAVASL